MSMARAQAASLGGMGCRIPDKGVEDELYELKSENMSLKKKLHLQDDRAKKLTTKVQRLSEDLMRNKEIMAGGGDGELGKAGARAKPIKGEFRNIEEAYDLIEDLRGQVKDLSKQHTVARNKMQYFRTLHEAETRRRTPYDHIPPRIQGSSPKKRLQQGLTVHLKGGSVKTSRAASPEAHAINAYGGSVTQEELEKLEEMNGMLRLKLSESDGDMERLKQEVSHVSGMLQKEKQQHDIDRAALQLELTDARKHERDVRRDRDALDERFRALLEAHQEALRVSDELNADLKEERRRGVEMEHELKKALSENQDNAELHEIINDLREEKHLLEQEQQNLLSAQFGRDREEEYHNEIEELRGNLRKHIQDLAHHLDEKRSIHEENEALKEHLRELRDEKQEGDRNMFDIQQELDELREKMNFFCKNGEVDLSEIEEALSIVRLRRERGISIDFLMEAEELYADKEVLQDLRVQYADCIHELEKVRKLLYLQEHINKDYKLECEELNRKVEALKNGYELRLEEDSRLLDLRANKIAHLEGQLKSIVYGTTKVPGELEKTDTEDDDLVELATGQNLIEIHIESALISDDGLYHIRKNGFDMEDSSKLTTFIHYDFFEFETQVSPMGIGQRPVYNCTSKFKVYTDDFFLQYLQSKNTVFYLALSNGLDSFTIATCSVIMKELTDPDRTDRLRYYADLISTHDGRAIIGKVDFGLRVRLPMAQAIRSFKERTVALNLLTVSDKEVSSRRFRPRADTNDLVIRIINCKNLRKPPGRSPAVFASFQFYIHESIVTDTVVNSTSPLFNFLRILPLPMTSDLDRYLRTAFMTIVVLDDNDGIDDFEYGSCTVPLLPLALGEKIYEEYFLSDGYGSDKSKITLSFEWSKPYKLNVVPLISQLDDQIRSSSGRSHKAAHSQDDDETESHDTSRHERARSDRGSEDMDKYHELNVDKLGQRSRHDSTESSRRTTTTEIPSTNDRISTTSVTTSTTDLRQKSRSDPALSTIDEHENGHRSRDSEQSDEEQREKEENERDRKSSKYSLSNKRSSKELALSSKGTSHESILSKYSKHEEDDEKRDKENGRPSSPKSKSLEDVKRSKKIADPRKKTSHKSLDHLGERKLSKDSHESLKPGENGRDQEDLGTRKSSHPSVKQEAGSHKSSHTSVKEKTNKNKEDLGSRKSSHKSLNGEKKKSDGLGSRKSSHKSVKEDEDESEKKSSREASKNSLKKSSDSVHNHHKSKDSVKKSQDSLKKSKEHLSSSDGSTGSDSDGESHSTSGSGVSATSDAESAKNKTDESGKTGDDTTSEVSESASSSIKSDTSKQSSPLSKTSSASSKSKSSENRSEEEDSELSDSGTATPKYHRSSEETVQSHIRDSESKSSSNESGSKNAESDSGTKELKSESGSKDSETGSRKSLSQSGSRSNNTSNESFHSANVSLTSKLSSESDSSSTVRAGRRGEQKELGSHDSFEQSSDHRTSSSSILSKVDRNLYGHSEEEEETSKETTTSSATQKESDSSRRSRDRTDEEEESNTDDIHFTSDDTHRRSDSETSNSHDGPSNFFKLQIDKVLFKTSSPKTMRLLESVYQFFVSFEFLNCPAEELETHSVERNDTGSHSLNFSKKFPMHPFKDERNRFALTRKLNSRDKRDATILFTIVSEPTEESEADAECEDIAYAKLDLMEVAHEGKDSVRRELQIWDPNGDILMGTMVIHLKGCSILSECLND